MSSLHFTSVLNSTNSNNKGFPDGSGGKESACNAGDPGSILQCWSGRSLGEVLIKIILINKILNMTVYFKITILLNIFPFYLNFLLLQLYHDFTIFFTLLKLIYF